MSFSTNLFESADLQANQRGELSIQQRHNLQEYIQSQGGVFTGYLIAVGCYWLIVLWFVMDIFYPPYTSDQNTLMMLIICGVVGVMTLPHTTRQLMMSYRTLQNYRENQVSYVYGVCHVRPMRHQDGRSIVTFDDVVFVVDAPHIQQALKPGQVYHVYYIGDVLLSFHPAQGNV